MKICFHHEIFDVDVSSGTTHAAYQWHELCMAFNVKKISIINLTSEPYKKINDSIEIVEYNSLEDFIKNEDGRKVFIEQDAPLNERQFEFKEDDWIIIGGSNGLPISDVKIESNKVALYPREAAAIILNEIKWQLR